jgi:hypothetical protein
MRINEITSILHESSIQDNPNFKRWFGDSKVVDSRGNPLRMYTGTSKDIDFDKFKIPKNGAWFTADTGVASEYAKDNDSKGYKWENGKPVEINTASRVMPVYLRIVNPYVITKEDFAEINKSNYKSAQGRFFDTLRQKGFDGINFGDNTWVVIGDASQIKSAIGNRGQYDSSGSITKESM